MLDMLERLMGQTWFVVTAFIVGPATLFLMYRRRWRIEKEKEQAARGGRAAAAPPAPRPAAPKAPASPAAPDPAAARKPLWPGFRDMKWGQPPADDMKLVHEEEDTRFLSRPADELRIGTAHVTSVIYSFRSGRLEAVVVDLPAAGFEALNRHLTSEWGSPRSSADRNRHVWSDAGTGAEASQAVLEKNVESRSARLLLTSRAAQAERAKARPAG